MIAGYRGLCADDQWMMVDMRVEGILDARCSIHGYALETRLLVGGILRMFRWLRPTRLSIGIVAAVPLAAEVPKH